jgi:uncharacterized OB-fold protein
MLYVCGVCGRRQVEPALRCGRCGGPRLEGTQLGDEHGVVQAVTTLRGRESETGLAVVDLADVSVLCRLTSRTPHIGDSVLVQGLADGGFVVAPAEAR